MNNRYQKIIDRVKNEMTYAAHDFDHVMRVYNICLSLVENKKTIDYDILIPAVLLHDIARPQEDEDPTDQIDHAVLGAEMAETILIELGYDSALIGQIKHCIIAHRFRSGCTPQTNEAKLLFDADKLDVIGAVGIARSFMLAGKHGERLFIDIDLNEYCEVNIGVNSRVKDVSKHSSNLEFELKLKKIPEKLYTEKAKKIAYERVKYMAEFFKTLRAEIGGTTFDVYLPFP